MICLHCSGGRLGAFGKLLLRSCGLESQRFKSRGGGKVESLEANAKEVTTEVEEGGTAGKLCRLNKHLWHDK